MEWTNDPGNQAVGLSVADNQQHLVKPLGASDSTRTSTVVHRIGPPIIQSAYSPYVGKFRMAHHKRFTSTLLDNHKQHSEKMSTVSVFHVTFGLVQEARPLRGIVYSPPHSMGLADLPAHGSE